MSGFEQSYAIRSDLLCKVRQKLAAAEHRTAVIETVRQTARVICKSDGITFVMREGERCHYVEEDAIGPAHEHVHWTCETSERRELERSALPAFCGHWTDQKPHRGLLLFRSHG